MISPTVGLTYVCIAFTCFDEETIRLALKHKHDRPLSLLGGECVVGDKHLSDLFCLFVYLFSIPTWNVHVLVVFLFSVIY